MRMPEEIEPQTSDVLPVLPYARADMPGANRWSVCAVLPKLLAGSLIAWITAINIYGLMYGSISRVETAAAFFLALITSVFAYVAELVLLCAVSGPRFERRDTRAVLAAAVLPPAIWLMLARAQLNHLTSEDALLFLLLGSVLVVPLLVIRRRP